MSARHLSGEGDRGGILLLADEAQIMRKPNQQLGHLQALEQLEQVRRLQEPETLAHVVELLLEQERAIGTLTDEIRTLRAAVALGGISPRRPLDDADTARLARLLPAIHDACGSGAWTFRDLCVAALLPGEHPAKLRAVLAECGDDSARAFGKFLSRALGHDVGRFRLARARRARGGMCWRVVKP